jgi:hypothetical protein
MKKKKERKNPPIMVPNVIEKAQFVFLFFFLFF